MIEELPHAHMVAGAEQLAGARVPDGEGEVAEQMLRAILAPAQIGAQDQFAVADDPGLAAEPERRHQLRRDCRGGRRR